MHSHASDDLQDLAQIIASSSSAYQFLNATDLPLCSQTLRPLCATAVLAALEAVCAGSRENQLAAARMQRQVAPWWPKKGSRVQGTLHEP